MNNIVEVYPNNDSDTNFPAVKFDEVREYNLDECWDLDGDELVVLMNTKTHDKAVYRRLGGVICMLDRFHIYDNVTSDGFGTDVDHGILQLLHDEAIGYGFPEECPEREPDKAWAVKFSLTLLANDEWVQAKTEDEAAEIVRKAMRNSDFLDWIKNRFQRDLDDSYEMDGFANARFELTEMSQPSVDKPINISVVD